jgi:hypothetical protein
VTIVFKDEARRASLGSASYATAGRHAPPARPLADRQAEARRLGAQAAYKGGPRLFGSDNPAVVGAFYAAYDQAAAGLERTKSILHSIRHQAEPARVSPEVQVAYDRGVRAAQCGLAPEPIYSRFARDQIREAYIRGFSAARTAMRTRG